MSFISFSFSYLSFLGTRCRLLNGTGFPFVREIKNFPGILAKASRSRYNNGIPTQKENVLCGKKFVIGSIL